MKRNLLVLVVILLLVISGCSQEVQTEDPDNTGVGQGEETEQNDPMDNGSNNESRVIVLASVLNVRDQAGLSGEVIGTVSEEDSLVILETKIDESNFKWYKVAVDNLEGWIAGWYCIDEDHLNENIRRAHLINAYDGHFDDLNILVDENKDAVINKMSKIRDQGGFMGGSFLAYDNYTFIFYGLGIENKSEGDIADILYHGSNKMYGVEIGTKMDQVKEVLGTPDREDTISNQGEESFYEDGTILLSYYTGSYKVTFISNNDGNLHRIQLSELVY